jgi:hypothetical protein
MQSSLGVCRLELVQDREILCSYLLHQIPQRFEAIRTTRCLGSSQHVSESSSAHGARARFECVRGLLHGCGIATSHRVFQCGEACGSILSECLEQISNHFLNAGFAQLRAKTLDIHVRLWVRVVGIRGVRLGVRLC